MKRRFRRTPAGTGPPARASVSIGSFRSESRSLTLGAPPMFSSSPHVIGRRIGATLGASRRRTGAPTRDGSVTGIGVKRSGDQGSNRPNA